MNIYNGYSSSFQEYRANHFHAGIDLRTFQKTGYPVHAVQDGYVFKVRVVKRGSGKGLYIKHPDGNTSIYFHLDRFCRQIENIVKSVQKSGGKKYFGNYFLKNIIRVQQGEVIAFSGESGYGFPHLHFEIRDKDNTAINPYKYLSNPLRDNNFPVMQKMIFRNNGVSLINGGIGDNSYYFSRQNKAEFYLDHPIVFIGNFDPVLNLFDVADTGKRVAPHKIYASINENIFYNIEFNRFSWADNNQLGFVYDLYYSSPGFLSFNLFSQKGFTLETRKRNLKNILEELSLGNHKMEINAADNEGNIGKGFIELIKMEEPVVKISNFFIERGKIVLTFAKLIARGADRIKIDLYKLNGQLLYSGYLKSREIVNTKDVKLIGMKEKIGYMELKFIKNGLTYYVKKVLLDEDCLDKLNEIKYEYFVNRASLYIILKDFPGGSENVFLKVKRKQYNQEIPSKAGREDPYFIVKPSDFDNLTNFEFLIRRNGMDVKRFRGHLKVIYLKSGIKHKYKNKDFSAEFAANSVNEPKLLIENRVNYKSDYPVLSSQVQIKPYNFPFLDTVRYKFLYKESDISRKDQIGIFKFSPRSKKWFYVNTQFLAKNNIFFTRVISSGTFALMRDIFYPKIYLQRPISNYLKYLDYLIFKITDKGKGVDDDSLKVYFNGIRIEGEYDPDWKTVKIYNLRYLRRGRNILKVSVKDFAGNLTRKSFVLFLK